MMIQRTENMIRTGLLCWYTARTRKKKSKDVAALDAHHAANMTISICALSTTMDRVVRVMQIQ